MQPSAKPKEAPPAEASIQAAAAMGTSLYAACVPVFRNVSGAWNPVGNAGVALVTGKEAAAPSRLQLVLYEPANKRPFSVTSLAPSASFAVNAPQYVALDDDQGNAWSLYFAGADDAAAQRSTRPSPARRRRRAAGDAAVVTQDVAPGEGNAVAAGDLVGVKVHGVESSAEPAAGGGRDGRVAVGRIHRRRRRRRQAAEGGAAGGGRGGAAGGSRVGERSPWHAEGWPAVRRRA